jgi:hypothetical protein
LQRAHGKNFVNHNRLYARGPIVRPNPDCILGVCH